MANQPADIAARANRAVIIAALIGAAATLATGLGGYKVGTTATPTATTSVTVPVTMTATVTVTAAPPGDNSALPTTKAPGPAGTVRFQGAVRLQQTDSHSRTDLDLEQPTRTAEDPDGDIYVVYGMTEDAGTVSANEAGSLVAKWSGSGTPDFGQCKQTALSEGGASVPDVKRGWILCVKTTEGRIARLKVVEVVKFASIRADAVVWESE